MIDRRTLLALPLATPAIARAQRSALRIAFVTTLSGPGAAVGRDIRDGFLLAVSNGRLGGVPIELALRDDAGDPDQARRFMDHFVRVEGLRLYTGIASTPILNAVIGEVLDEGGIYVSPNAGPADRAGRHCHPNYFVISCEDDTPQEAAGANATRLGHASAWLMATDTPAGHAALAAFRRGFKGSVAGESLVPAERRDFGAELARIRAAGPAALFSFQPGAAGLAFLRAYQAAGLAAAMPLLLSAPSFDEARLAQAGEAALGAAVSSNWNGDFDNVANRRFMADFPARYGRAPSLYASRGYDTALALGAAFFDTHGELEDTEAFRRAMFPAVFASVRGSFLFGRNQHPIQDWWSLSVRPDKAGAPALVTEGRIFKNHDDFYASLCKF